MNGYSIFCVSDHTGVTVESVAKSVLAQFPHLEFSLITLPFVDSAEKAQASAARIATAPRALIFSTLTDPTLRLPFRQAGLSLFYVYELIAPAVESALGPTATPSGGHTHGMASDYEARMDSVNFAIILDDVLIPVRLDQADLILVGVSRVCNTPTALYLALQYGLRAANYPLTPDDLEQDDLPACLKAHLPRLRGLTQSPERLAAIRQARYPDSRYASLAQCRMELGAAEAFFKQHTQPDDETTQKTKEENTARLRLS